MSTHKHINAVCYAAIAVCLVITILFMNGEMLGITAERKALGYESKLFDTSSVHSIEIVMDDWDTFLENCTNEEYVTCTVLIDNEAYKNVAIRAKGNTSLSSVKSYGNDRYSFKIEFDHYDNSKNYYGLDKLCLNNIIQDNTYMKDYLTYQMMGYFGVSAPLCSYAYVTVNGEDFGLYLAVEGVEESFLMRNYGNDYGKLYKPDSLNMGGGRGNGKEFTPDNFVDFDFGNIKPSNSFGNDSANPVPNLDDANPTSPPFINSENQQRDPGLAESDTNVSEQSRPNERARREDSSRNNFSFGGFGGFGSNDVSLIYTDDSYDSYSNIFDNAKTEVSDSDKDRLIAALKNLNEGEDIENTVDIDEVIRYFVVHNFVVNFDSYTGSMIHNYYLYEKDGKLSMIPWDYNLAFGTFQSSSDATSIINYPIDTPVSGGDIDSRPMLAWIFNNEEYTKMYHEYFDNFIAEFFENGYFENMITGVKEMIAPYVQKDPTEFCTYEEFETGIATLRDFCMLRVESVRGQLDGVIPSTSQGQQDTSAFVNAEQLVISNMGTMGNGNRGGGFGERNSRPQQDDASNTPTGSEASASTDGMPGVPTDGMPSTPNMPFGDTGNTAGSRFDNQNMSDNSLQSETTAYQNSVVFAVSVCVLIFGLIVAFFYKRK